MGVTCPIRSFAGTETKLWMRGSLGIERMDDKIIKQDPKPKGSRRPGWCAVT